MTGLVLPTCSPTWTKLKPWGQPVGIQGLVAQGEVLLSGEWGSWKSCPRQAEVLTILFKPTCRSSDLVLPSNHLLILFNPRGGLAD